MTRSEGIKQVRRIALYLFFFSINFEVWDPFNTDGYFSISKLTGFIYVFTIIPMIRYFNKADTRNPMLLSIWLFFVILTVVSLFNINNVSYGFFDFTIFQDIFLFWFLLIHERKDKYVLEKGMLSFALGSVVLALLFYAGIGIEYDGGRVKIFGDNPNIIGLRISISMAILVLATLQNRLNFGKARYLLLIPIPIMLGLMVGTGSRVAFVSFSIIFVTGVFLYKTKNIFNKISLFASGSIASTIIIYYLLKSEIFMERLLLTIEKGDLAQRDLIWQELLPIIEGNPILGIGKTGYAYFSQKNFGGLLSPHNVFIEILCYTGIVGLIVYLLFLFRVFKEGYKNYKEDGILLPILLLIPVVGMLLSGQILDVKIGWVIFAYVVGGSILSKIRDNAHKYFATKENNTAVGKLPNQIT